MHALIQALLGGGPAGGAARGAAEEREFQLWVLDLQLRDGRINRATYQARKRDLG